MKSLLLFNSQSLPLNLRDLRNEQQRSHYFEADLPRFRKTILRFLNDVKFRVDERNCLRIFAPKLNREIMQTNDISGTNAFRIRQW